MLIRNVLLILVALLHVYFMVLEMFLWTKPRGLKTFGMNLAQAKDRAVLAANQGLYNGFLATGLVWAVVHPNGEVGKQLALFFTSCVVIAAAYGGYSVSKKILFIQGAPALLALLAALYF
jgi:putative membrane protein